MSKNESRTSNTLAVIEIEETNLTTKQKKDGSGSYQLQAGYFHSMNQDGSPKRYPEEINVFPKKDPQGNAVPYPVGSYTIDPASFRVQRGFFELGFLTLIPVANVL